MVENGLLLNGASTFATAKSAAQVSAKHLLGTGLELPWCTCFKTIKPTLLSFQSAVLAHNSPNAEVREHESKYKVEVHSLHMEQP